LYNNNTVDSFDRSKSKKKNGKENKKHLFFSSELHLLLLKEEGTMNSTTPHPANNADTSPPYCIDKQLWFY